MTDDNLPIKNYFRASNITGIVNTWRNDGHQSCQFRLPSEMMAAVVPASDLDSQVTDSNGNLVPKNSDQAKAFAKYGTVEIRKSDFFALLPLFVALGRANGATVSIDFGDKVPFVPSKED